MSITETASEIVMKLIENGGIIRDEFPQADTYVDAVCMAYKKVYMTVASPEK